MHYVWIMDNSIRVEVYYFNHNTAHDVEFQPSHFCTAPSNSIVVDDVEL